MQILPPQSEGQVGLRQTCQSPDNTPRESLADESHSPDRELSSAAGGAAVTRPITQGGYDAIQDEIDRLWSEERPMVVQEVSDAADLGDRSENAAYIYGKKRLRQIDSRMRYLSKKLAGARPVDLSQMPQHPVVKFGAVVTVEDEDGEEKVYRLVDREESDPGGGRISVQSPVGTALLGKEPGDVVTVRVGERVIELEITGLRYGGGEP